VSAWPSPLIAPRFSLVNPCRGSDAAPAAAADVVVQHPIAAAPPAQLHAEADANDSEPDLARVLQQWSPSPSASGSPSVSPSPTQGVADVITGDTLTCVIRRDPWASTKRATTNNLPLFTGAGRDQDCNINAVVAYNNAASSNDNGHFMIVQDATDDNPYPLSCEFTLRSGWSGA
jgi:hypothetical protein